MIIVINCLTININLFVILSVAVGMRPIDVPACAQVLMPLPFSVTSVLDFVRFGVETNWWGLGCPLHCGSPSVTALLLSFLSGLGFGLFLGALTIIYLAFKLGFLSWPSFLVPAHTNPPAAPPAANPGANRLLGHLHEQPGH